eukprot:12903641-Prorocentrum_lima.AAC.1
MVPKCASFHNSSSLSCKSARSTIKLENPPRQTSDTPDQPQPTTTQTISQILVGWRTLQEQGDTR